MTERSIRRGFAAVWPTATVCAAAIFGSFCQTNSEPPDDEEPPLFRISGFALMGGVEVHSR